MRIDVDHMMAGMAGRIVNVQRVPADVQRLASSPNGTIGRARADSVIIRNVHRSLAQVDSLIADVKKHPLRYISF